MIVDTDEKREKRQIEFDETKRRTLEEKYRKTRSKGVLMQACKEGIDMDWSREDDQFN